MISQKEIHQNAVGHGFWEGPINIGEKLCLIHSEVSEALEVVRASEIHYRLLGEELADIIIRTMDLAEHLNINLEHAVAMKHRINMNRPYKHGKRF